MREIPEGVRSLERDLDQIFGDRLRSLVLLAGAPDGARSPVPTLALVTSLDAEDLAACAGRVEAWHEAGLATPIVMPAPELGRSIDVFPLEFSDMVADHVVVRGPSPFEGLRVDPQDLRRACERQARSHLLHLREGFLETRGRGDAIASLISRSAAPLAALIKALARLQAFGTGDVDETARRVEEAYGCPSGSLSAVVRLGPHRTLPTNEARRMFQGHLEAVGRLASGIDSWSAS